MPSITGQEMARTRAAIALATRLGTPQQQAIARRNHAAAKLAAVITRIVDNAPPLTVEQRDRLVLLLRNGSES